MSIILQQSWKKKKKKLISYEIYLPKSFLSTEFFIFWEKHELRADHCQTQALRQKPLGVSTLNLMTAEWEVLEMLVHDRDLSIVSTIKYLLNVYPEQKSVSLCWTSRELLKEVLGLAPNVDWMKYNVGSLCRPALSGPCFIWPSLLPPLQCSPCFSHIDYLPLPWGGCIPFTCVPLHMPMPGTSFYPSPFRVTGLFSSFRSQCKGFLLEDVLPVIFHYSTC